MTLQESFDYLTNVLGNQPTDKGTYHNYIPVYQNEFNNTSNIKLLEIGVYTGGSLKLWDEYFTNAEIHGIEATKRGSISDIPGIMHWGMYEDLSKEFNDDYFDYIINDSMHDADPQIDAFYLYYPKLKNGGKFFMEDIPNTDHLNKIISELENFSIKIWDMRDTSDSKDSIILVITK